MENDLETGTIADIFNLVKKPCNLKSISIQQRQRTRSVIWNRKQILICPNNMGIYVKPLDIPYVPTHFVITLAFGNKIDTFCNNCRIL